MRKGFVALLCVLFALTLCACEDGSATVSNGSKALVTVGSSKVTREQLYNVLKAQDENETTLSLATSHVIDAEVEMDDALEVDAKEKLADAKASLEDYWDMYLEYLGYASEEEYYNKVCVIEAKRERLATQYIEENWDDVMKEYYPTKVKIIQTSTTEAATNALKEVQDGANFEEVAEKYTEKSNELYDGKEHLITRDDDTTLSTLAVSFIRTCESPTLSQILNSDDLTEFYVIQVIACDPTQYRDEAIEAVQGSTDLETEYMSFYFQKHNFKVYDIEFYNFLKEKYPTYLHQ